MKFRRKPLVVDAFQMTEENWRDNKFPQWFAKDFNEGFCQNYKYGAKYWGTITTLYGDRKVAWNDYVVKGVNGELYPIKRHIFEKTYEKVE